MNGHNPEPGMVVKSEAERSRMRTLRRRWMALGALLAALGTRPIGPALVSVCPPHTDPACNAVGRFLSWEELPPSL